MGNTDAMRQLADQLNRRFSQSRELQLYEKGSFDEWGLKRQRLRMLVATATEQKRQER